MNERKILLYVVNVDWYFELHWLPRAMAAKSKGFDVHVLTQITSHSTAKKIIHAGLVLHALSLSRKSVNPLQEISSLWQTWKIVKRLKPTLVHSITIKPNLYSGLICKITKKPIIISVTGRGQVLSGTKKSSLIDRVVCPFYRYVSKNPTAVFLFENQDDQLAFHKLRIGNTSKHYVIAGAGVDIDQFNFIPTKQNNNDELSILFAGRLLWSKGLLFIIQASRMLKSQGIHIKLLVAGIIDNDNRNAIPVKQIQSWAEQGDIEWLGFISDMPNLISQVDIVVLPTQYGEGVPRILIEAAAMGKPIIASNTSGCNTIVHHNKNGYLIEPQDIAELADSIKKLQNYELRKSFGLYSRNLVEETFCQSYVIKDTLNLYERLSH